MPAGAVVAAPSPASGGGEEVAGTVTRCDATQRNGRRYPQVDMSSQQFPRSGAPPAGLGPAPPPIPTSGSAGLIAPAAPGKRAPGPAGDTPCPGLRRRPQPTGSCRLQGQGEISASRRVPSRPVLPPASPAVPGGVRGRGRTGRWAGGERAAPWQPVRKLPRSRMGRTTCKSI